MNPKDDGKTHINVYSKGATALGRWLSNFTEEPFTLPDHGRFASIEGFWYWLGARDDRLRNLYGYKAKELGRSLERKISLDERSFRSEIERALWTKALKRPDMVSELVKNELPLAHYYVFDGKVRPAGYEWILEIWRKIREESRSAAPPGPIEKKMEYVESGGGFGTSEKLFIRVQGGEFTEKEILSRFGGTWGGRVEGLQKFYEKPTVITVWAYAE